MKNRHARILVEPGSGFRHGRGVTIETEQSAVRDEFLQNRPCMSASAVSGIHVRATCLYVQRSQYLR
jgi:hypothetical protein